MPVSYISSLIEKKASSFVRRGSGRFGEMTASVMKRQVGEWMSTKHRFQHYKKIMHISIIDYLQEWNLNKKGERFYKTTFLDKDPDKLSAIEPEAYAQRFKYFME